MTKPKYRRFSKFSADREGIGSEAQRLIKLKHEIKRLKRQRLIVTAVACLGTGAVLYLLAKL
jgi:hypothetical protein